MAHTQAPVCDRPACSQSTDALNMQMESQDLDYATQRL